jgi:hypothetical protein
MSRRAQDNVAALVILGLFVLVIVLSLEFGPRARMIPLPLAIFGIILTIVQIVWQNVRSTDELQIDLISVARPAVAMERADERPQAAHTTRRSEVGAYGIVALLLGLVLALGPIPAVMIFTGGYFVLTRHYSWLVGLIYTVAFTLAVYLLFFVGLQIQPYHGLLEPLIARFQ